MITVSEDKEGGITITFPYNPLLVAKVKTIPRHRIPALQSQLSTIVIARSPDKIGMAKQSHPSSLLSHNFEDLRRELVSRKYSYKTVKGYLYYNKDFIRFAGKAPSDINDKDIKNYLLYLVEEKQAATSTLNQAINALKFYYGSMLKKKFIYEIKNILKNGYLKVQEQVDIYPQGQLKRFYNMPVKRQI